TLHYTTLHYTTLHYTPHYKFFRRFFHCKKLFIKELFETFKRFLWREKLSTPIYYIAEVLL
ncbi:hypothetical protein, partial [Brachyspira aalborgi]|uniref:hypothetical protein n=1 Tax=Brachyspira aalborgi TaxID=29522 RepID=UPI001A7E23B1